jgi:hypothetical protein
MEGFRLNWRRWHLTVPAILFVLVCAPVSAGSQSKSACAKLENQIEKYTKLRQAGGTAKQMDRWHRKRTKLKRRFSELRCKY